MSQFFIPRVFEYLTLSEFALINYHVDNYYDQEKEDGISYNDSFLNIDWGIPHEKLIISEKR